MSTIEIKVPEDNQEGTQMKVQNWLVAIGDFVAKDAPLRMVISLRFMLSPAQM